MGADSHSETLPMFDSDIRKSVTWKGGFGIARFYCNTKDYNWTRHSCINICLEFVLHVERQVTRGLHVMNFNIITIYIFLTE